MLLLIMGIGYNNSFVSHEAGIEAEQGKIENTLGAGYKKMKSQGLAVDKYKEVFLKALEIGTTGRYGKNGVQAAMTWISESQPNLEPKVFQALQDAIEVTFNKFEAAQNARIDKVRAYKVSLGKFPGSMYAGMLGFPKLDLKKYEMIISSAEAKEAMESGELPDPSF